MVYPDVVYDLMRMKKRASALDAPIVDRAVELIVHLAKKLEEQKHENVHHTA